jgi:NAD(P)-dependent dehydrogenase (short-subunit alcohol dehydrogenase family)
MDLQLNGKRALITGSTVGIGFAIAKALAVEGAQVTVNGRTEERVSEAKRRIATEIPNAKIAGVTADLSSSDGVTRIIEACPEIDILVNNVGIFEPRAFEQISDADWLRFFEVNVMSGVRLSRHYLPQQKDRNWGRIVFISRYWPMAVLRWRPSSFVARGNFCRKLSWSKSMDSARRDISPVCGTRSMKAKDSCRADDHVLVSRCR